STLSVFCTGMRTTGSSSVGKGGGGGASGSGSSLGGRLCAWTVDIKKSPTSSRRRIVSILLEVQQHLALRGRGREAALRIEREDRVDHVLRLVEHLQQIEIVRADHAFSGEALAHPVDQAAPVGLVHQDDRHLPRLAGLHQGERLEQ